MSFLMVLPDGWDAPRFQAVAWLGVGSGKAASPRPAHPQVTHTVGRCLVVTFFVFSGYWQIVKDRPATMGFWNALV